MSSETIIILLGILIFILPFIGLPFAFLAWILPLIALGVIGFGYLLRAKERERHHDRTVASADRVPG